MTKADIVAWKDALLVGHAPKGVRDGQLAAVRRLYAYALENDLLTLPGGNPTQGVKVPVKYSKKGRAYTDDDVARLLARSS